MRRELAMGGWKEEDGGERMEISSDEQANRSVAASGTAAVRRTAAELGPNFSRRFSARKDTSDPP